MNHNLGTISRKRFTEYAFVLDTLGQNVTFTPLIDNVSGTASTVNTANKLTYIHYFLSETIGTDIGGILGPGNVPFEFYGLNLDETVSEKLPVPRKYLIIPNDDYGTPNRKRHSSYKFQINTRGQNVSFTPKIDGVLQTPATVNTSEKRTFEYFFTVDTIGIDIGGILESLTDTPFEFYGVIRPQHIEVLPPRLKEYYANRTNFGIPAKKRVRTLPMMIDTGGSDVTFTPIVDGVNGTSSVINTTGKTTAFHYFSTDVFGIDFAGEFVGTQPFEFYQFEKPEEVEVIPVGKKFDQIGPIDYPRMGKLLSFRVRVISNTTSIPFTVYVEDVAVYNDILLTNIGIDKTYEFMHFPKTIAGTNYRIELGPTDQPFHRYYGELKVNISGMGTDAKWDRYK
jgi:hypothetical protein